MSVGKKGIFGPFSGSQGGLDQKTSKKMIPEIIVNPNNFNSQDNSNLDRYNHVRFKDDSKNHLPSGNNFDLRRALDSENYTNIKDINPTDLKSLKDAVPIFNKSGRKNKQEQSLPDFGGTSNQNALPQLNRYVPNPILNKNDEIIYSSDDGNSQMENVYSIANSYAQPGIQAAMSAPTSFEENINLNKKSLENIYSQVVSSSNRNSTSNQPRAPQQPTFSSYRDQNGDVFDTSQPLYMNSSYLPNLVDDQINIEQVSLNSGTPSKNFDNWNNSPV